MDTREKEVLNRILDLKSKAGLSDYRFCGLLNIQRNSVDDWKREKTTTFMKLLPEIADLLNVTVDILLGKTSKSEAFALSSDTDYDDLPPEALEEIEQFKQFVRSKYKKK